jgi:hypothetical protein
MRHSLIQMDRLWSLALGICLVACSLTGLAHGQGVKDLLGDEKEAEGLDILDDLNSGAKESDLALMKFSHLSLLNTWEGVKTGLEPKDDTSPKHWQAGRPFVTPLDAEPISTLIEVPQKGKYRVYLRQVLSQEDLRKVKLTLTAQKDKSAKPLVHEFGTFPLLDAKTGKEQEAELPVRFESELQLKTFPDRQMPVWEYWEVELSPGTYRASLQAAKKNVQAEALFLTRSMSLRPSFTHIPKDNTLQRIFVRFKLLEAKPRPEKYSITAGLTYHWRGRPGPSGEPLWGYHLGDAANAPGEDWSPFIDGAEAIVPGPGPWSTCRVSLTGVKEGKAEVQFAWYPHEAAVLHEFTAAIGEGQMMFRIPHGLANYLEPAKEPRWGVWNVKHIQEIVTEDQLVEQYLNWAKKAASEMGLKDDHPMMKNILLLTSCRVGPAHRERASEMLARLGVNWIDGAPQSIKDQFDLYDGSTMTKIKEGDEIGTYTPAKVINNSPPLLAEFHEYLRSQAALSNTTVEEFLGVSELDRVRCLDGMPENPGRFERRLAYHSHRFCHMATIEAYAPSVRNAEAKFKNAVVYNNYSPHPTFLTGNSMNGADWFLLARAGAQTLGWGEDWATGGSWGLGTDRAQCVTFYAAMVECSVRKRGYPSGFYVGSNCGHSANKIFSCVGQGIDVLHLYDWGPIDAWAEGSNAWSESESEYKSISIATHALGPADEIIGKGEREPRRTAVLYNRSHEILSNDTVSLNHDWLWAYSAIKTAQIPVDLIIEEDLTPEDLKQYDVLYLGGLNLEARHLAIVSDWVKAGGLLIGTGGSAMYDAYNDLNPATEVLFGAKQTVVPPDARSAEDQVIYEKSDFFPAASFQVASPAGHRYTLSLTTAEPLAKYSDGQTACVTNQLGKGRTILYGFYPGLMYRSNGRALGPAQPWFTQALLKHLGRQKAEFSYPASEVTLFEHPTAGLAVMLANFTPYNAELSKEPTKLSVLTDRKITEVTSGLRGPLKWKRVGDRIEVETPSPADLVVDTVILK